MKHGVTCRYEDSRGWCCAAYNEVAIDYNAAFTGALARLVDFFTDMEPFSDCTLDLGWSHANATLVGPQSQNKKAPTAHFPWQSCRVLFEQKLCAFAFAQKIGNF